MKKESSIKKKSREFIVIILTAVTLFYITLCAVVFFYNYQNIRSINENILTEFHSGLDDDLYNTQQYVINIYANNVDYRMLVTESGDSYDIYARSLRLKNLFESKTGFSAEHFGFFIQKDMKNGYYSSYPIRYSTDQMSSADRAVKSHLQKGFSNGIWYAETQDEHSYLILAYHRGTMTVGAVLDLGWYATLCTSSTADVSFALGDSLLTESKLAESQDSLYYVVSEKDDWSVAIRAAREDAGTFRIRTITPQTQLMALIRILLLIFFVFVGILFFLVALIEKQYYSAIVYPIQQISRMEESLRSGTEYPQIRSDIIEYNQINDGIRSLIGQVTALEKESHEKEMAFQASQLQYFQLQTEPHFFLNCLKNIYAMAENRQFEKIQYMVTVISRHFRYVFRSNTLEIPLKEELDETDCYFQLCQFSSTVPMILEIHREEALENCRVPPLLVQTFVENSIKYGRQINKVLRIVVEVSRCKGDILIRITDDGIGYAPEILDMVRQRSFPSNGHIGIKNAIDRIGLLYEGRAEIRISNNETCGARTEISIPLAQEETK